MGPAIITLLVEVTNNIRNATWYLIIIHIVALCILATTDFEAGQRDCNSLRMAMRLKAIKNQREANAKRKVEVKVKVR